MDFKGKTALVTGAASGIGRAVAITLAQMQANLVLIDAIEENLEAVKNEIQVYTDRVLIFKCDVSNEQMVYETIKKAEGEFQKIDILINNAGVWRCWDSFADISTDEWRRYIDINIMGTVHFTKAVLPKMIESRYGKIVNVASVAGVYGNAFMTHYSATKGAIIAMTKALAKEVAEHNININSVSPGSVSPSENLDIDSYQYSDLSFMGRTGTGRENANLICFLASEHASYISGQNIQIDGSRRKQ